MTFKKITLSIISISIFLSSTCSNPYPFNSTFEMRQHQIEGAATSLLVNAALLFLGKKIFANMPSASAQTTEFVQTIGDQYGIPHDYDIKIGSGDAAGKGTIIVEQASENLSSIDRALYNFINATTPEDEQAAREKMYEIIGILDHEFGHYKHNDVHNAFIATSAFSVSSTAAYLALEHLFFRETVNQLSDSQKKTYGLVSGLGLSILNIGYNFWYRVRFEKQADEHVRNNPHILKAMIAWTQRIQNQVKNQIPTTWLGKKCADALEKYPSLYYLLDPVHPPLPYREARFKERLAELEK